MKKSFLDMAELIRSIQRSEGNPDCFRRAEGHCDQLNCAWRVYCLEDDKASGINDNTAHGDGQRRSVLKRLDLNRAKEK